MRIYELASVWIPLMIIKLAEFNGIYFPFKKKAFHVKFHESVEEMAHVKKCKIMC